MTLVATETFRDPTDGQLIKAGRTLVAEYADVVGLFPERFRPAPAGWSRAPSTARSSATKHATKQAAHRADYGADYRDVELVRGTPGPASFRLDLLPAVRSDIERLIGAVRKKGPNLEAAGWLFARNRPRAHDERVTIVLAYSGRDTAFEPSRVTLGDPYELREDFPQHLRDLYRVGDWHSHPGGSALPSDADLRAWAGNGDALGVDRYVSVIVSRDTDGSGWWLPRYSGWSTAREGYPSRPVCRPIQVTR
jgi:proteasome lid subunit RPN8/RPN11